MKAKLLAELLMQNPEAEVMQNCYTGCLTESLSINESKFIKTGEFCNSNGGQHLDKAGFATKDLIILS